jgi:hypothetical protein
MKSQLFIADLVFTASIFALVFFFLAFTINQSVIQKYEEQESMKTKFYAEQLASLITMNPGVPFDWHKGNMIYPGAVDSENQLNFDKVTALMGMDLNDTFQLPYPTSLILDEVVSSDYYVVNCSQYLITKYGNCTYSDEGISYRLLYSADKIYRLQVIIGE